MLQTGPDPTAGSPTNRPATQLSHIRSGSRSVPCRLPRCGFRVCELLWAHVSCFCGFPYDLDLSGSLLGYFVSVALHLSFLFTYVYSVCMYMFIGVHMCRSTHACVSVPRCGPRDPCQVYSISLHLFVGGLFLKQFVTMHHWLTWDLLTRPASVS